MAANNSIARTADGKPYYVRTVTYDPDEMIRKIQQARQTAEAKRQSGVSPTVYMPGAQSLQTTQDRITVQAPAPSALNTKTLGESIITAAKAQTRQLSYELPGDRLPTASEILARIATIAQTDMVAAETAFEQFKAFQADASSPYYNPYTVPSNWKALQELGNILGEDLSGGVSDEWMETYAFLLDNPRYTATGTTPAAPTKTSTAGEDAAYWYYQLRQAQENTFQAEDEWRRLKEDIAYLVSDPRSYSDEEILARVDLSKYTMLSRLMDAKDKRNPTKLNRALDFSEDAILGAIWAARNGGGTGNSLWDAANHVLGFGERYQPDTAALSARDPYSPNYNPNAFTTLQDEARYFGVEAFDWDWVNENRWMLESPNKDIVENYQRVYGAMGTWDAIETEWNDARDLVAYMVQKNFSDDQIRQAVEANNYSALKRLDEGRDMNKPLALPQGTNVSLKYVDGLIWAARNNGGTGDPMEDTRRYQAGAGQRYQADTLLEKMRTPGTPEYNPYFESNVHDVLQYFGVEALTRETLDLLQPQLSDGNQTTQKMFSKAVAAVENSEKAQAQLAGLWQAVQDALPYHTNAEELLLEVAFNEDWEGNRTRKAEYGTLWKMDDSRYIGDPVMLGYAVDYRWEDLVRQVEDLVIVKEESASAVKEYATYDQLFDRAVAALRGTPYTEETVYQIATRQAMTAYAETPMGRAVSYYARLADGAAIAPAAAPPLAQAEGLGQGEEDEERAVAKRASAASTEGPGNPQIPAPKPAVAGGSTAGRHAATDEPTNQDKTRAWRSRKPSPVSQPTTSSARARIVEQAKERTAAEKEAQAYWASEEANRENEQLASIIASSAASVTPEEIAQLRTFFVAANGHPEEAAQYMEKTLWQNIGETVYGTENVKAFTEKDERRLAYLEQWALDNPELAQKATGLLIDPYAKELKDLRERQQKFTEAFQDAPTYQDVIRDFYADGNNTAVVDALVTGLHVYSSFDYPQIYEYIPYALSSLTDEQLFDAFRQQLPDEKDETIAFKVGQVNAMRSSITRLYASPVLSNEADGWLQAVGQFAIDTIRGEGAWQRASFNADMDLQTLNELAVNDMFDLISKTFLGLQKIAAAPIGAAAEAVGLGEAWNALEEKYIDGEIQANNARLEASANHLIKNGSNTDLFAYTMHRDLGKATLELAYIGGVSSGYAQVAGNTRLARELPRLLYGLQSGGATAADLSQRVDLSTPQWLAAAGANGLVTWGVTRFGVEDKVIRRMMGLEQIQSMASLYNLGARKYIALYGRKGLNFLKALALGFGGEYLEEGLEEAISTPLTNLITGDEQPDMGEYLRGVHRAGFQGGLIGMMLAGISLGSLTPLDSQTHRELVKLVEQVDSGVDITVGQALHFLGRLPMEYAKPEVRNDIVDQSTDMMVSDRVMDLIADGAADAVLTAPIHEEVAGLERRVATLQADLQKAQADVTEASANLEAAAAEQTADLVAMADPLHARNVLNATNALLKTQERQAAIEKDLRSAQAEYETKSAQADALGKQTMHDLREEAIRSLEEEARTASELQAQEVQQQRDAEAQAAEQQVLMESEREAARQEAQRRYDEARAESQAVYSEYQKARDAVDSMPEDTDAEEQYWEARQRYAESDRALTEARSALEAFASPEAAQAEAEQAPVEGAAPGTTDGVLFASMARQATNLNEGTEQTADTGAVRNPIQISKKLAQDLKIGEAFGTKRFQPTDTRLPRAMSGYYLQNRGVAVSRNAADFDTNLHEIGHAVLERTKMQPTADMLANLDPAFAKHYASDRLGAEAFAEFVRQYIVTPEKLTAYDNQTVTDFEAALKDAGLYDGVRNAREDFQAYRNADIGQRANAMVVDRSAKEAPALKKLIRDITTGLLDATRPAEDVNILYREQTGENVVPIELNVREAALWANFDDRRAANLLTVALSDPSGDIIGKSLADVLADSGVRGDGTQFQDLSTYLLLRHSFDREAQGKPVFDAGQFPSDARQAAMQALEAKYPHFERAADAYDTWWHDFTRAWLVDTGFMTPETWQDFREVYPHYVPTYRKLPDQTGGPRPTRNSVYKIRTATGSSLEIYNPFDNIVTDINRIVRAVSANNVALTFDRVYNEVDGMGWFGRPIDPVQAVAGQRMQKQIEKALAEGATGDMIQDLMTAHQEYTDAMRKSMQNAVRAIRPDGSVVFYEINDQPLYDLLSRTSEKGMRTGLEAIGRITRGMTMLTTGSNPMFAITNALRDYQQSVSHGSWASNYITALPKWLRSFYEVWRGSDTYAEYQAMGGGGWLRVGAESRKAADAYRADLFKGYDRRDVGSALTYLGKKVWSGITLSQLNEIVENTSRYAEYRFGKHDRSTPEGRLEAFRESQEATVDFTRRGNAQIARVLRQFVPFFNANAQGAYQQGRDYTRQERDRAGARFTKTVINTSLATVLAYLLRSVGMDEEDREAYAFLSADLQNGYFILPNPFEYDRRFLRIPVSQAPLARAVHGTLTQMLDSGARDEFADSMLSVGSAVLDGVWPVNSTIADPIISIMSNRNWYGGTIVPERLQGRSVTRQYTETTPELFVQASRALNAMGVQAAPLQLQYLADQLGGWIGDLAIPALSPDRYTGELGGMDAVLRTFANRLTIDPAYSNDVTDAFYRDRQTLDQLLADFKAGEDNRYGRAYSDLLGRDMTPEESMQVYNEAYHLRHTVFADASDQVSALWDEIEAIYANDSLTRNQQNILAREKREDMVRVLADAETEYAAFQDKYIGKTSLGTVVFGGPEIRMPTALDNLADVFKGDLDDGKPYMLRALEVFEASDSRTRNSMLPHPNDSFQATVTQGGQKVQLTYTITDAYREEWDERYRRAYEKYLNQNGRNWENLTLAQRQELLRKAHTAGHNAAKEWFMSSGARMREGVAGE